jgi:hypothetical protein
MFAKPFALLGGAPPQRRWSCNLWTEATPTASCCLPWAPAHYRSGLLILSRFNRGRDTQNKNGEENWRCESCPLFAEIPQLAANLKYDLTPSLDHHSEAFEMPLFH